MINTLFNLEKKLIDRQNFATDADEKPSYVHKLYEQGIDGIAKKVAEEMAELILASKSNELQPQENNVNHVIYEAADLLFHTMVLLQHQKISFQKVLQELERREGVSGLIEKANRL